MTPLIAVALLLFASADEPAPVVRGRLCLGLDKTPITSCSDVTGTKLAVTPADTKRLFVWTSADAATAHVGVIPAKAESIDLAPDDTTSVLELSLDGDRTRGWPNSVALLLTGKSSWRWTIDTKSAPRLRRVIAPRGTYAVDMRTDHHRRFIRPGILANEPVVKVGELRFQPLPIARGVVIDSEEKALANATVTRPDGMVCATANEQGAFECELTEPNPDSLVVSKAGFGPRELRLERGLDRDVDLGRIALVAGHTLTLKIVRPDTAPARVTLFHDAGDVYEHAKLKTVDLRAIEEEVRFDVGEGRYVALVAGDAPLERLDVPILVKNEDVTRTITVAPYRLLGNVRYGEELLADGTAEIVSDEQTWRASVPIADGAFGGTMWQTGRVRAFILRELLDSPELGEDPTRWEVHIQKRLIAGRVFDAETKQQVPNAKMQLTAAMDDTRRMYTSVELKSDGTYEIPANRPGTYSLRVTSPEHVLWTVDVPIAAADQTKKVDVALERGIVQRLDVVTPAGAPIANATVLEGFQPDRVNVQFITRTDAGGRYELRGKPGEARLLYVVPPDGSFAVVRVQVPRRNEDARPMQVVVPPGTSSLRVRATTDDKPVAAPVLLRYNGEFVPGAILRFVTRDFVGTQESGEVVLSRLPAGTYEVWALAGPQDEEALIAGNGSLRAPARTGLSGGEQAVQVVAPPREVRRGP
jgi:hypothetical protein